MDILSLIMAIFAVLGAIDLIFGDKFGLGSEFEKGFMLFGTMALTMIGAIIIAPLLGTLLSPAFDWIYNTLSIDPSLIPSMILANDMGGASLSTIVAKDSQLGAFNALVVSSMMGCTISFTIPFALGLVKKENHKHLFLGILCGIATIPIGCLVAGLILEISFFALLKNIIIMFVFSAIIVLGLIFFQKQCIKVLSIFGYIIKIIITIGLTLGIVRFLTGIEIIKGLETLEEGARICLNATTVMAGAFPLMRIISLILTRPLKKISNVAGINEVSAFGFLSSLATSMTTFKAMNDMDEKGIVLNSAFAVSGAFTFAGHLAFTMSFNGTMILPVIIGKLVSAVCAVVLAIIVYRINTKKK